MALSEEDKKLGRYLAKAFTKSDKDELSEYFPDKLIDRPMTMGELMSYEKGNDPVQDKLMLHRIGNKNTPAKVVQEYSKRYFKHKSK